MGYIAGQMVMKSYMKLMMLVAVMAVSPHGYAQAPQGGASKAEDDSGDETEKEWAVMAQAGDTDKILECFKTVEAANGVKREDDEYVREIQRLQKILNLKKEKITKKDLLGLRKVRSIQVGRLGVFKYPYFNCRFKEKEAGLFFEKITGSQRRSGIVFVDEPTQWVFLGGWSVNDNRQHRYSSLIGSKVTAHDSVGIFVKRGGRILAIFPGGAGTYEVYEFKK